MKVRLKNRKAVNMSLEVIVGAIVIIVIAGFVIFIVRGGLSTQQKNIDLLSSCRTAGGSCEFKQCPSGDYTIFPGYGCPEGSDKSKDVCCIPKNKPNANKQIA